ncbi:MAG: N-formylglutamate amidohydrolase [Caldimonas sp.]
MPTALFAPSYVLHGPGAPQLPLVLDSPHSGFAFPADFGSVLSEFDLREAEDCFVDQLWMPATERGVAMIAALAPRTYIDLNRHAGDIDLGLIEGGHWPDEHVPSGKAKIGKSLIWRTLDDGRAIYERKFSVDEVRARIEHYHRPYHGAVRDRIAETHDRFGHSWHIDCHSMNAVGGAQAEGGAGRARADIVLGDRDGTTCDAGFTELVRGVLAGFGYDVKINDPYKGVELVRAYSDPAHGRMSLQVEVNKRLYMNEATREKSAGFDAVQKHLSALVDALVDYTSHALRRAP